MIQPTTISLVQEGAVARIRFLRDRIDMRMVRELTAACDHLEDASACRILVFEGAPELGCFLRGIDFADFRPNQPMDIHGFGKWERICTRVERLKMATIAAIDGPAVGGGVQLALCCDLRLGSHRATLQLDEVLHGFLPGMATWRLSRYVGLGRAKRMVLQGTELSATAAHEIGLLDEIGYPIEPLVEAGIKDFGPAHAVAIQLARRLLNESSSTAYEDAIGNFLAAQHRAISQSAFLDTVAKAQKDGESA